MVPDMHPPPHQDHVLQALGLRVHHPGGPLGHSVQAGQEQEDQAPEAAHPRGAQGQQSAGGGHRAGPGVRGGAEGGQGGQGGEGGKGGGGEEGGGADKWAGRQRRRAGAKWSKGNILLCRLFEAAFDFT